jgi:hypothetical protein
MSQFVVETSVKNGHLELNNIPFADNIEVKVIIIPKVDLTKMSFPKIWDITKPIQGKLSADIAQERDER